MVSTSFFASLESQKRWRLQMKYMYSSKTPDILPCVFQVPDSLKETKPEAYTPQVLGLGPYHHFGQHVQSMSIKKRAAVYHILKAVKSSTIENYEDFIRSIGRSSNDLHYKIRSCYERFVDLDHQTLSWIVVMDSIVLWHLISSEDDDKLASDIFMLENQIPAIIINDTRKVLGLTRSDVGSDEELRDKFYDFCATHCPLTLTSEPGDKQAAFKTSEHILQLMYELIMRSQANSEVPPDPAFAAQRLQFNVELKVAASVVFDHFAEFFTGMLYKLTSIFQALKMGGLKLTGNMERVSQILLGIDKTLLPHQYYSNTVSDVEIPSVSRLLCILNVAFKPLPDNHGITNTRLTKTEDGRGFHFYLPVIKMGPNSEVIISNLVAYEASMMPNHGSTCLRDYVALMCGLVRTPKDVQLLSDARIMKVTHGLQNKQIVGICRRISKSHEKPAGDSKFHAIVKDASHHFNKTSFVKFWRLVSRYLIIYFLLLLFIWTVVIIRRLFPDKGAAADLNFGDPQAKALMLPRKLLL